MQSLVGFLDSKPGSSSNVKNYLASAALPKLRISKRSPPMPPKSCKSHCNFLKVVPERTRRIKQTRRLAANRLIKLCSKFIDENISSIPIKAVDRNSDDDDVDGCLALPCELCGIPWRVPCQVRYIDEFGVSWINGLVLQTVERIMKTLPDYRETAQDYSFTLPDVEADNDKDLFRYYLWEKNPIAGSSTEPSEPPVKLIVAYQLPWILSLGDLEHISGNNVIPPFNEDLGAEQPKYNSCHRVWCKLYDICKVNKCNWFVLTNYNEWVFGGFSKGWECGFVSNVKQPRSITDKEKEAGSMWTFSFGSPFRREKPQPRLPTILEFLIYWVVSSMKLKGGYTLPSVIESLEMGSFDSSSTSETSTPLPVTPMRCGGQLAEVEPSESNWGSVHESWLGGSAHVQLDDDSNSVMSTPYRLNANWEQAVVSFVSPVPQKTKREVKEWLSRSKNPDVPDQIDGYDHDRISVRSQSPVQSEWSDRSLASRQRAQDPDYIAKQFIQFTSELDTIVEVEIDDMDMEEEEITYYDDNGCEVGEDDEDGEEEEE